MVWRQDIARLAPLLKESAEGVAGEMGSTISPKAKWNTKFTEELSEDANSYAAGGVLVEDVYYSPAEKRSA